MEPGDNTSRPLVALDVDGVVFPVRDHDPGLVGRHLRVAGFPVFLPAVIEARLADSLAGADLVWLTSWEEDGPAHVAPLLRLPDAPHLPLRRCTIAEKLEALSAACGDRPLVWADDMIGAAARRFAVSRPAPTLLVRPDARRGLGPRQMARVRDFLTRAGG